MAHPLIHKVQSIRRRATRLGIYYGVAAVLAAFTAAIIVVAFVDYAIGIQDRGVRLMCSVAVWLVLVASVRSFLFPALRRRWSDLGVSQRLERHFPQLGDRLSNAIAFLAQREDDPTAGSAELRRAVIAQAEAKVAPLTLSDIIDARGPWRMAGVAALVALAAVVLSVTYPATSSLAARRLLLPWGNDNWPPVHQLAFELPPHRVTIGSDVQFTVVDRSGRLPESVYFYYRYEEDSAVWPRQMTFRSGKLVHELKNVTRSLQYRAAGGDDRLMPWQSLTVVEPLRIEAQEIQLIPPAYTGWPAAAAQSQVHALEGTEVKLTARATRPLAEARVKVLSGEDTSELVAELAPDGRQLRVPGSSGQTWLIRKSGAYWFELRDLEGTEGGTEAPSAIRAVPDRPPDVLLEQPSADVFVTAHGIVPLRAKVQDDLAIHTIQLDYRRSDQANQADTTVELFQGPAQTQPSSLGVVHQPSTVVESRSVAFDWDLSQLEGLEPGVVLHFNLTARDYKPQETRSDVRRVTIITPQELDTRIAQRQADIRQRLEKVARLERDIRAQVSGLERQWTETGMVKPSDLDQLRGAEWNQRDVELQLAGADDSIQQHIAALLAVLEMNRADLPQTQNQNRLRDASRAIEALQREHLSAIEKHLVGSRKAAQTMVASSDSQAQNESNVDARRDSPSELVKAMVAPLGEAGRHQDAVIARLEQLLKEFTEADNYQQLVRDMQVLDEDHEELMRRSESLRRMTFSRQLDRLSPEERADLQQLSLGQYELARRFDKLLDRMRRAQGQLPETDSSADQAITNALTAAERLGVAAQMLEARRSIAQNQLGRVAVQHQQIDEALGEMSQILAPRRASQPLVQAQLAALVKALEVAIQRQDRLIDQAVSWEELRAKQGPLAAHQLRGLETLAAEQRQLAGDTASLSLNAVQLPIFQLALQGASHEMTIAANRLASHDTSPQTQHMQKEALARLVRMAEALKSDGLAGDQQTLAGDSTHQDAQRDRPTADNVALVAQLKLLKQMQVSLYERTAAVQEARRGGRLAPELGRELELLAQEQGRLAELLVPLTSGAAAPDESVGRAPRQDEKGTLDELDKLLEESLK